VTDRRPIKVAVVGGGCASIAAAFELTRPEHAGRYQVTVYQLGWRLGGKGASGRGPNGRIEEHGLHVWMGWYENAFRLLRECYAELGRDRATNPIADWQDAFVPAPLLGVVDCASDGSWIPWSAALPPADGLPGDPSNGMRRWTVRDYMVRSALLLRTLFETIRVREDNGQGQPHEPAGTPPSESLPDTVARLLSYGQLATLAGIVQGTSLLEAALGSMSLVPRDTLLPFLDAIASNARRVLEARLGADLPVRRVWQVIDLTLATLRGGLRFGLMTDPRGFDAIDEYDCREWLLLNGASESSLASGYLRALYDLGFSYEDGDAARPRIAAGQALRGMVRTFFTYRGAVFWKMQAGMGDVVFAPFYQVLKRRGVRFEFFHRLENVQLGRSEDPTQPPYVDALAFDVQADVVGGGEYAPLVQVGGLPCWPAGPDYRQLVDGARLEREGWDFDSHWDRRRTRPETLRVVDDFDLVVLGVGLGAIPHVCPDIVARDPRWRAMVEHVKTVATQAFQIWLRDEMKDLGWAGGPITLSGFTEPFDTWADMSHLLTRERWPHAPRAIAYFCSVLPNTDVPNERSNPAYVPTQREQVRRNAIRFLTHDIARLWPHAVRAPGEFRWELLVDPSDNGATSSERDEGRFASQFWTANVNPSDRYVLSMPGSAAYRISPLDRTYDNLTVAGDWTDCGFNAGCVEAAVISGRLAAHAISLSPRLEDIVGYDHP
jgi:uncharacterized protein with NAD-binding domain and iron-sulfur cluster